MRAVSVGFTAIALLALGGCDFPITQTTECAWQRNFRDALVPGYSDFRGLDVDSDTGFYVFTYRVPDAFDGTKVMETVRDQIAKHNGCFKTLLEAPTELQMRCRIETLGEAGFDEYHLLFDPNERRATVMFGNFDSIAEQRQYEAFLKDFREAHRSGGKTR